MKLRTVAEDPSLSAVAQAITEAAWPSYILNARSPRVTTPGWAGVYAAWPELQLVLFDGDTAVAVGNTVPLRWERPLSELPDDGWDWVMNRGYADDNRDWNLLGAVAVSVHPDHRGRGLSGDMLRCMKLAAGGRPVVVPVRPSQKADHPTVPIDAYMARRRADGLPQDAWLRVHERVGGRILHSCSAAMTMVGTAEEWTAWTGVAVPPQGEVLLPDLLSPLRVSDGVGTYVEPNVWVVHEP